MLRKKKFKKQNIKEKKIKRDNDSKISKEFKKEKKLKKYIVKMNQKNKKFNLTISFFLYLNFVVYKKHKIANFKKRQSEIQKNS